jgi:hypothetical protein
MVPIDTPAHIQYAPKIENGVRVQGGTNYDLSRGGVSTPVVRLPDPVPVMPPAVIEYVPPADLERTPYEAMHRVPAGEPILTLHFARNAVVLTPEMRKSLAALKDGKKYVVVGHADSAETEAEEASKQRAAVVAKQLKRAKVIRAVSFADTLPLSANPFNAQKNRRVEIFLAPETNR